MSDRIATPDRLLAYELANCLEILEHECSHLTPQQEATVELARKSLDEVEAQWKADREVA